MEESALSQYIIGLVLIFAFVAGVKEYKENYELLPPFLRFNRKQYEIARDLGLVVVGKTSSRKALEKAAKMGVSNYKPD